MSPVVQKALLSGCYSRSQKEAAENSVENQKTTQGANCLSLLKQHNASSDFSLPTKTRRHPVSRSAKNKR
jgi:hypothetical protein